MRRNSGFTLVEILIVVIILGILAAIVIPQFTQASSDAKLSSVVSDLQTTRSQVELFKLQHSDQSPYDIDNTGATFWQLLTSKTDADGTLNAAGKFGPYLQKIPANPFVLDAVTNLPSTGVTCGDAAGADGWWFDTSIGQFKAAGTTPSGIDLSTY